MIYQSRRYGAHLDHQRSLMPHRPLPYPFGVARSESLLTTVCVCLMGGAVMVGLVLL